MEKTVVKVERIDINDSEKLQKIKNFFEGRIAPFWHLQSAYKIHDAEVFILCDSSKPYVALWIWIVQKESFEAFLLDESHDELGTKHTKIRMTGSDNACYLKTLKSHQKDDEDIFFRGTNALLSGKNLAQYLLFAKHVFRIN